MVALLVKKKKHIGDKLGNHSNAVMKVVTAYAKKVTKDVKDKVQLYARQRKYSMKKEDSQLIGKKALEQAQREMKEKKASK